MANHQKFIKYLLSFVIALSPVLLINNANAASLGGWSMGNPVAQGASAIVSATKNVMLNGTNVVKTSTALITPTAIDVAKLLGKGLGGVALSVAVQELLGAVDWVLDPANNQIIYKPKSISNPEDPANQYYYSSAQTGKKFSSVDDLCIYAFHRGGWAGANIPPLPSGFGCKLVGNNINAHTKTGGSLGSVGYKVNNPAYDPAAESDNEEKTIPLPTVANQVISNAQAGNADAQAVTVAAAADIINDAENDSTKARPIVNQLENNSKTATDETATGKADTKADEQTQTSNPTANPANTTTDISLDFPVFCGWAPTVCEAMKVVLNIPTLVSEYAESVKEYFKEDTATDTTIDIPELPNQEIDTDINFSSSCPANFTLANFSYHGTSQNWEVDFSKFCDVFGTYVKPVVIAMGAFSAALIIGGVRTND